MYQEDDDLPWDDGILPPQAMPELLPMHNCQQIIEHVTSALDRAIEKYTFPGRTFNGKTLTFQVGVMVVPIIRVEISE